MELDAIDWHRVLFSILGVKQKEGAQEKGDGWIECHCPLPGHADTTASCAVNVTHGGFNCAGCAEKGGGVTLYGLLEVDGFQSNSKSDWGKAKRHLEAAIGGGGTEYKKTGGKRGGKRKGAGRPKDKPKKSKATRKPALLPTPEEMASWQKAITSDESIVKIARDRKWSLKTLLDLGIGYKNSRFMIPVYKMGEIHNLRMYMPGAKAKGDIKIKGLYGRNSPAIYPEIALQEDIIWIFEGEPDAIAARSHGINGIALCTGAKTMPDAEILSSFKKKKVIICFDTDSDGIAGSKKLSIALKKIASYTLLIDLKPLIKGGGNDFSDYLMEGGDAEVIKLMASESMESGEGSIDLRIHTPSFENLIDVAYVGKTVKSHPLMIIGKSYAPSRSIRSCVFSCEERGDHRICSGCPISHKDIKWKATLTNNEMLQQVGIPDYSLYKLYQSYVNAKCDKLRPIECDDVSMTSIVVTESVEHMDESASGDGSLIHRNAIVFGADHKINTAYQFIGTTTCDPKTQKLVHLFSGSEMVEGTIDGFEFHEDDKEEMKVFFIDYGIESEEDDIDDILDGIFDE